MRSQLRWALATVLVLGTWTSSSEAAGARTRTRVSAHVAPATAYVHSAVTVTGTVVPLAKVTLERLVGKHWKVVAHQNPTKVGTYTFTTKAPGTAGKSRLRVVSGTVASHTLTLVTTKKIYHVTLTVAAELDVGTALTVAGRVTPKATGSVLVQHLAGRTWVTVAKAALKASAFSAVLTPLQGTERLRVVKPFSASIAGGLAPATSVSVLAAPAVTTTALPRGSVDHLYSVLLAGTGGKAPYTWSLAGLTKPAGLALTPDGQLTGTPDVSGDQLVSVVLTDGLGVRTSRDITLTITPRYGPVQAWGRNLDGALGDGTTVDRSTAMPVAGLSTATSVVGAGDNGYALLADGTIWGWGSNVFGQLGVPASLSMRAAAAPVPGVDDVVAIAASNGTVYALRRDGTVWAWGNNGAGDLGDGTTVNRAQPAPVAGLTSIVSLAAGAYNGYFVNGDGAVWALGANGSGELGDDTFAAATMPVRVLLPPVRSVSSSTSATGYAIGRDGTLWAWGNNGEGELGGASSAGSVNAPVQVPGLTDVVAAAGSFANSYALTRGGTVFAWGTNYSGQLGHGGGAAGSATPTAIDGLAGVVGVSAGGQVGYALLADGSVEAWGTNVYGQLGDGGALGSSSATPAPVAGLTGVSLVSSAQGAAFVLQAR